MNVMYPMSNVNFCNVTKSQELTGAAQGRAMLRVPEAHARPVAARKMSRQQPLLGRIAALWAKNEG